MEINDTREDAMVAGVNRLFELEAHSLKSEGPSLAVRTAKSDSLRAREGYLDRLQSTGMRPVSVSLDTCVKCGSVAVLLDSRSGEA